MSAINLLAELKAVPGMVNRTLESIDLADAFGPEHSYRDGFISTVKFSGTSAWERHSGDEILLIMEGKGFLLLRENETAVRAQSLHPGYCVVVPSGHWHRIESDGGIGMITVSPQPTDHAAVIP